MTDLTPYKNDNIIQSYSDMEDVAKALVQSGFFQDTRSISQAIVKILAGREVGIGPFASMRGVHIIKGNPSYNANVMASLVKSSGKYNYHVVTLDDTKCEIAFSEKIDGHWETVGTSTFTIADARKAGTQNIDKFPRNMLFARAMSNGVKWFCPDVMNGQTAYVPEEMGLIETEDSVDDNFVDAADITDVTPDTEQPKPRDLTHELNVALGFTDEDENPPAPEPKESQKPKTARPLAPATLMDMLKRKAAKAPASSLAMDNQIRKALQNYFHGDEDKRHALQNYLLGVPNLNSKTLPADAKMKSAIFDWLKIEDAYMPDGTPVLVIDKNAAEEIELIMAELDPSPKLPLDN